MGSIRCSAAILVCLLAVPVSGATQHDKTFWRNIATNKFAVPAGASIPSLVQELSGYLASPDPDLRDDIAYSTLVNWIYRQKIVSADQRRQLLADWTANLRRGIGERGTDSVFRRSFSALALGILAIADNESAYLEKAEFDGLLAAALMYLRDERDVRGFDPQKGWIHTVAHTADLLKFLGRSRHLEPEQQVKILQGLTAKIASVDEVLTHGEDERLARAVLSIAARADFNVEGFRAWASGLAPVSTGAPPTPATLAVAQNRKNLVVSLFAVLSADPRELPSIQAARGIVLGVLKQSM